MDEPEKKKDEEYELIAISPLRRLEKRIDQLEHTSSESDSREFYKQLVEIIRMNQQIVDELAKSNDALRIELSKLPARLENVASQLGELISYIKNSANEDVSSVHQTSDMAPLLDKMQQIVDSNKKIVESNQTVVSSLEDMEKKMRKPFPLPPPPAMKRPLFPPKPI